MVPLQSVVLVIVLFVQSMQCVPKKYDANPGGFLPSSGSYYKPVLATESSTSLPEARSLLTSEKHRSNSSSEESEASSERVQRFGISGYGGGYPGGGGVTSGGYVPMKIDLGGVVLGTLIGLGAVLIFPKLAHVFSGGYGGYGGYRRSTETSLAELMASLDTALEKYNIDSSSCMQRLVCTTVQNSRINMAAGHMSSVDQWVDTLTRNSLFSSMLDGTAIKEAVDAGWGSEQNACNNYYPKCAVNKQTVLQLISNMLPA